MAEVESVQVIEGDMLSDFWQAEDDESDGGHHRVSISRGIATHGNEELKRYQERVRMLDRLLPSLRAKYPDNWVALTSNGSIVAASTVAEMIEKLEQKRLPGNDAAVKFIATSPRRMIL